MGTTFKKNMGFALIFDSLVFIGNNYQNSIFTHVFDLNDNKFEEMNEFKFENNNNILGIYFMPSDSAFLISGAFTNELLYATLHY